MQENISETDQFAELQKKFAEQFASVFPDRMAKKAVVIIPSLTLDADILDKIDGHIHYEERLLCLLMLLRMPNTHVIYVTSIPVHSIIMDYYLHLLPGITNYHARQRLKTLSCFDSSPSALTQKILTRPRLINRIRNSIPPGYAVHLACFNVTEAERKLAVKLGMPIYGCDPALNYLGTKSYSRKIFKECKVNTPPGFEDCKNEEDVINALCNLKWQFPTLANAVVKLDEGFSGEGNAVFCYDGCPSGEQLTAWVRQALPSNLNIIARELVYETYMGKLAQMGGIVEAFVDGVERAFPSVQCRINPLGECEVISTHDQVLGGEMGHVFLGAHFPASEEYSGSIGELGKIIAVKLKDYGVVGRFSLDFISVKTHGVWNHYAIEINLRKGGTTHPFLMLEFLTEGAYDANKGVYLTATGQRRYYLFSDNLQSENYKGITPHDLIEISTTNDLLYSGSAQQGVIFHMIGALSQFGKLGILCIGATREIAQEFYNKTVAVLSQENNEPGI